MTVIMYMCTHIVIFCLYCSFESPSNQAMAKKVQSEVRSVYGKEKWKKAIIRGNKFLANPFSLKV